MRPLGALSTLEEVYNAKTLYCVTQDGTEQGLNPRIFNNFKVNVLDETDPGFAIGWNIAGKSTDYPRDFLFANYWHARAYALKLRGELSDEG